MKALLIYLIFLFPVNSFSLGWDSAVRYVNSNKPDGIVISAVGNVVVTDTGPYRILQFTVGVSSLYITGGTIGAEMLVIGGGAGAGQIAGGGAGGGYVHIPSINLYGSYSVVVGSCGLVGGAGTQGEDTTFGYSIIAKGGGAGGAGGANGQAGGSGGGSGYNGTSPGATTQGNQGWLSGYPQGLGNRGGAGQTSPCCNYPGGGGGGAGGVGQSYQSNSTGGNGGLGISSDITGSTAWYAAGGSGGCQGSCSAGAERAGGGPNAYGGGGNAWHEASGPPYGTNGGGGTVIIKYVR